MNPDAVADFWWDLHMVYSVKYQKCKCEDHRSSECPFLAKKAQARLIWERVQYQPNVKAKRVRKTAKGNK